MRANVVSQIARNIGGERKGTGTGAWEWRLTLRHHSEAVPADRHGGDHGLLMFLSPFLLQRLTRSG